MISTCAWCEEKQVLEIKCAMCSSRMRMSGVAGLWICENEKCRRLAPSDEGGVSHGICKACAARLLEAEAEQSQAA